MWVRNALIIGGLASVASLGAVAAYSAAHPGFWSAFDRQTRLDVAPAPAADPVRRASRIDGDMRATFELLEKSGAAAPAIQAPVIHAKQGAPAAATPSARSDDTAAPVASEALQRPTPQPPAVLAKPAKGMPTSLVPQRSAAAEASRVMDPRMTRALDLLSAAPRATVAAVYVPAAGGDAPAIQATPSDGAVNDVTPTLPRAPVGVVPMATQVAEKNEAEMTADDLNAREHKRIRRTLEGSAGGTN